MFTIEFVVFANDSFDNPRVTEKVTSSRFFLYDAEHLAKLLLKKAKRRSPADAAHGYRILDAEDVVVARSWKSNVPDAPGPSTEKLDH